MVKSVKQYRKKLRCKLYCTKPMQDRLLAQFDGKLANYLEENDSPSMDDLISDFGPIDEMARILMEPVSEEEVLAYQKQKAKKQIISIVLVIVAILLIIFAFFWKQRPIVVVDEVNPAAPINITENSIGG